MLISVICPTYGRVSDLQEAVYSFLNQTYVDKELIILNDYDKQTLHFDHPQIKILNYKERISSLGLKKNIIANLAKGELIIPLDDDDIMLPNYLENCKNHIEDYNWFLPFKTFIFNKKIKKIQLSWGGPLNTFIYKKKVLANNNYPQINFNINKPFITDVQKTYKGKMAKLAAQEIGYISTWDQDQSSSYHVRIIGQEIKDNIERYQKIENHVNQLHKLKLIHSGNIELKPKWKKDYVGLSNDFIKLLENSKVY